MRLIRIHFADGKTETRPVERVQFVDNVMTATQIQEQINKTSVLSPADSLLVSVAAINWLQVFEGEFVEVDRQQRR